jgi:hypothetical protein
MGFFYNPCNWSRSGRTSLQTILSGGDYSLVPSVGSVLETTMRIDLCPGGQALSGVGMDNDPQVEIHAEGVHGKDEKLLLRFGYGLQMRLVSSVTASFSPRGSSSSA